MPMITGFSNDPATMKQLDDHAVPWTIKPVVDALTLYKKTLDGNLWQKGLTGMQDADCLNALYAGKGAGFYSGSWNPVSMYKNGPADLMKRMKVMQTPAVAAGGRHWTGNSAGAAFSVTNGPNKDAALTFFKYLYSPEVYAWTMIQSASMPATKSAAAQISDPFIKLMTSWLADGCRHWLVGPAGQPIADAIEAFTQNPGDPQATAQAMEDGALKVQPLATAPAK
jgi:ABC-type glycerol-3-phosphate transport system substrate-binding protein